MNAAKALSTLKRGNERYVTGEPRGWRATPQKRIRLAHTQHPLACVITCSDSRVSPELIFDQCIGDLFVVRNAGTILTPEVIGSVEFAVSQLDVPLVVVMAHSGCGAIAAAVAEIPLEGAVAAVIRRISPIVKQARKQGFTGKELESEVSRRNTVNLIHALPRRSHQIKDAVDGNAVELHGAFYDLASGRVHWHID
jgi:carbonic anhydrase